MSSRLLPRLAILAALIFGAPAVATEPDGRVAFRYDWPDKKEGEPDAPKLRLSMTAFVDLAAARLSATLPTGIGLSVQGAGRAPAPWPEEGLAIGDLAAGRTVVIDLDIENPPQGGGIIGFLLLATTDGREVREGLGVPVGVPGTTATLRNGAVEFPAAREDKTP